MLSARMIRRSAAGVAGAGLVIALAPSAPAGADPSAATWQRLRVCESSDNYSIDSGNGHYGAYQFDVSTWRSVGGTGRASTATPGEQDARALILYRLRGWQPWQCATILGLKEDGDARSGVIADIKVPISRGTAPDWPGTAYGQLGDSNAMIARWKTQMSSRGARLADNGIFGAGTLTTVNRIQKQNGLPQTGLLGPVTWALAWRGDFTPVSVPAPEKPAAPGTGRRAPAMPGPHWYVQGDHNATIARWQVQMHTRGASLNGTGVFGPNTLKVVKRLQQLNGLAQTGVLGPETWKLAWAGRYL